MSTVPKRNIRLGQGVARCLAVLVLFVGMPLSSRGASGDSPAFEEELAWYDFRDTRRLVRAVREAADLVEAQGEQAFALFRSDPKRWNNDLFYVYVYDLDGACLYHPSMPEFEGRNLLNITDAGGNKALQMALAAAVDPDNPHGWLHYLWQPAGAFNPVHKSSCHFDVTMPDGRRVVVGGGMEDPREEKVFAQFAVDSAVRLLAEQGGEALREIGNPATKYRFRDVKVFVLDEEGNTLVDPALDSIGPRNMRAFTDASGHRPFASILEKLAAQDRCWEVVLVRNRFERIMEKKTIYARAGVLDGRRVIVGAATSLPKPIWSN